MMMRVRRRLATETDPQHGRLLVIVPRVLLVLLVMLLLRFPATDNVVLVVDGDALGHVVDLVDADEAGRELKHVVAQRDDDELRVLGAFFDVVGHDGDLDRQTC